jgi:glycolate oxidase FAD binding subunit
MTVLTPATANELCDAIRAHPRVLAIGARTKPRLSAVHGDVALISTRGLSGITAYDPGEFTFTALAGTPLSEIRAALAERGQYLPFDPPLADSGATIGGTVAAGLSGPGRFRYGGVRDFILAVQFADGTGQLLRGGAKVVKNAAGFDIPKFLVGSCGRFGVLVEVTFKVFPTPQSWLTLRIPCAEATEAAARIAHGASSRWELDALDWLETRSAECGTGNGGCVLARLGGPAAANAALAGEIKNAWPGATVLADADATNVWSNLREFAWAHADGVLAKIPITLATLDPVAAALGKLPDARGHFSAAGNVAFVSLPSIEHAAHLDAELHPLGLSALVLRGIGAPARLGFSREFDIAGKVRAVFDPMNRFAPFA